MDELLKLSEKQKRSLLESNAKINVWEGAVRSGKTFISLWRFILELSEGPEGEYVLICRTNDAFTRNVLPLLELMIGVKDVGWQSGHRRMNIYGKRVHVIGADDERAGAKIRGPTFSGAYVDEITIIPEAVFKMLISRCAMGPAKIFGTTNPDSPYHWLKRDILSQETDDVKSWQFTLEDNPELTEDEKNYLKRQYKGLWYQRFIEGKWVQAEGSIYDYFDEKLHVIDFAPSYTSSYLVGVDYGTTNPCAFVLIGYDTSRFPHLWVEDEYYFDSRVHQRQKTDSEYASDLAEFISGRPITAIYLDPSAVSFRIELQKIGVRNVYEADNKVLDGIRFVSKLLDNETLKICRKCKNVIKEFQSYVWDEKSAKTGIDKPKKENDHCFVAGTMISTLRGDQPIETILPEDKVKTRSGYRKVVTTFKNYEWVSSYNILGRKIIGTDNHPFLTLHGWKNLSDLIQSDILFVEGEKSPWLKSSNSKELSIDVIQNLKTLAIEVIFDATIPLLLKDLDISIETFGSPILEKYHQDTIFITKTGIPQTILLAISNVLLAATISPIMEKILPMLKGIVCENMRKESGLLVKRGIKAQKDTSGIKNMANTSENLNQESKSVKNVGRDILQKNPLMQNFVRINVKLNPEESLVLIMNKDNACFAKNFILPTNLKKEDFAQSLVQERAIGKRITYNIHVEEENEYYAEGILVHNCMDALRYALFTHLFGKDGQKLSPQDIEESYLKSRGLKPNLPRFFQDGNFGMY